MCFSPLRCRVSCRTSIGLFAGSLFKKKQQKTNKQTNKKKTDQNKTRRDPGNGAKVNMQWASAMCVMMFVSMQCEQPGTSVETGNRERGETHVRAGATRACLPDTAGLEQTLL